MKYLAACLFLFFSGGLLYAQKSTYLKAEAGFGRGTVRTSQSVQRVGAWQPMSAGRFAISGGVRVKKLSLEIGFGYGRSGGRQTETILRTPSTTTGAVAPTSVAATKRITHLTLPVSMGYDLRVGKRWAIQPRLGLEGVYTTASKTENEFVSDDSKVLYFPLQQLPLNPLSLHATGALQLHYRVTPGIEIFGGPSYRHMLTNGAAETLYIHPPYYKVRTSSTTFDAGVIFRLKSSMPTRRPAQPTGPQE